MIFDALVQTLIVRGGASGHFGFGPLVENANIFRGTRPENGHETAIVDLLTMLCQ